MRKMRDNSDNFSDENDNCVISIITLQIQSANAIVGNRKIINPSTR